MTWYIYLAESRNVAEDCGHFPRQIQARIDPVSNIYKKLLVFMYISRKMRIYSA